MSSPATPAGVERPHGELRARLADRLGRDDADRLADLDDPPGGQVPSVAEAADADLGLARDDRPDAHRFDAGGDDDRAELVGQLLARERHLLASDLDVLGQDPAEDAGLDVRRLHGGAVGPHDVHLDGDAAVGTAVVLADDQLLRHVDQAPREVPRVGGTQRGVGQPLAGAVRGDEVLQHGQALAEVRLDRARDDLTLRVGHQAAHTGKLTDLHDVPSCSRVGHHEDRVRGGEPFLHGVLDRVGRLGPDLDQLLTTLVVGDDPLAVLALDLLRHLLVLVQDLLLGRRHRDVLDTDRHAGTGRVVEPEVLQVVERLLDHRPVVVVHRLVHEPCDVPLQDRLVPVLEVVRERVVEQHPPDRRADRGSAAVRGLRVPAFGQHVVRELLAFQADPDRTLERVAAVERQQRLVHRGERRRGLVLHVLVDRDRQVVETQHHVLGRRGDRTTVRRRQDVVGREHQDPRLGLRLGRQRHVHRHLVPVEVGVERRADERVDLDGLALHEHRLECLDTQSVERRCAVQHDRVLTDDLFEHVPHLRTGALHHALGALDVLRQRLVDQPLHHERLEQLERHLLGQTALVQGGAPDRPR